MQPDDIIDPSPAPNIVPRRAHHLRPGTLDGFAVELGERHERNDLVVDVEPESRGAANRGMIAD
jgi:hypothetical protein